VYVLARHPVVSYWAARVIALSQQSLTYFYVNFFVKITPQRKMKYQCFNAMNSDLATVMESTGVTWDNPG